MILKISYRKLSEILHTLTSVTTKLRVRGLIDEAKTLNYLRGELILALEGEENMADQTKPWYQSKTILAGIVGILIAMYNSAIPGVQSTFGFTLPVIPEFVFVVLGALGIYGRTTANTSISK